MLLPIVTGDSIDGTSLYWPLEGYLKNTNLVIEQFEARWSIIESRFYLIEFLRGETEFDEHFNLNRPMFADWIDGIIELGLPAETNFENHLRLKIEKGVVVERNIIQVIPEDKHLDFLGNNKQQRLHQLIYGKMDLGSQYDISEYLYKLLNFITKKDCDNILFPFYKFNSEEIDAIVYAETTKLDFFITSDFVAIGREESNLWGFDFWNKDHYEDFNKDISKTLSVLMEKILTSDFSSLINYSKAKHDIDEKNITKNNDINYLNRAIENEPEFVIHPNFLKKEHEINRIKTFEINRLNNYTFEYFPIYLTIKYIFPLNIRNINLNKFCNFNNVKYYPELLAFIPNLNGEEMNLKFGDFLNDYYQEEFIDDNYDNSYRSSGYSDNWLEDAAGSNDPETMNDAYWNMD